MPKAPKRLFAILAVAFAGFILSLVLTQHYYGVRSGVAGFHSMCERGSQWSCNTVAVSAEAELVAGMPLSSFAAGFFVLAFALGAFALNRFWRREALRGLAVLAGLGTIVCVVYLVIMVTRLHTGCLYCLGLDLSVLALLGLTLSLGPEGLRKHKLDARQWKTMAGVGALAFAVVVLGTRAFDSVQMSQDEVNARVKQILATSPVAVRSGPEYPSLGADPAPITIVEFSDFQCPFCRIGAFIVHTVQTLYPKDIRVVFRNYPLDPTCNPDVKHSVHAAACEAASLAWCAHQQKQFGPVYEEFFEKQALLTPGNLRGLIARVPLNAGELDACAKSDTVRTALRSDIEEAQRLGVSSTPTFFINGYRINGAFPVPVWKGLITELLARRKERQPVGYALAP